MSEDIKRRDSLKKTLIRFNKLVIVGNLTAVDAKVHLESLDKYFDLYIEAQLAVDGVTGKEAEKYEEIELANMENLHLTTKIFLKNIIEAAMPPPPPPVVQNVQNCAHPPQINTKMKIGAITLPKFGGEYREWPSFSDLFTSLVRNDMSISAAQKLYLLKAHLTGEAEGLIKALPVTDANFTAAWTLIENRFNNKRFIVEAHLKTLLGQPKLHAESAKGLKSLVDSSREAVRCLEALELPVWEWDAILVFVLTGKLDPETHRQWELGLDNPSELSQFEELLKFLDSRWKSLEMIPALAKPKSTFTTTKSSKPSTAQSLVTTQDDKSACGYCKEDHDLSECARFKEMDVPQRRSVMCENKLCFKCLRPGHTSSRCSAMRCPSCKGRHHKLLHQSSTSQNVPETLTRSSSSQSTSSTATVAGAGQSHSTSVSTLHSQGNCQVVLSTAIVIVKDEFGQDHLVRALLDTGSEATFMTEDCAQRLHLRRSPAYVNISGVGKTDAGCTRGSVTLDIASRIDPSFQLTIKALILNKITNLVPREHLVKQSWPHLRGVTLADVNYDQPGRIDMLIGADIYGSVLLDGLIASVDNSPTAQNTRLGWILLGRTSLASSNIVTCNLSNVEHQTDLENSLRRFWEIESLEEKVETLTVEERACEDHFLLTHSRDDTGRFVVRLPLMDGKRLGESRNIALKRFQSVERRLSTLPDLKAEYVKFMREYEFLDHMRPVSPSIGREENLYFLPHHAVLKESSSTTKVRVVFDASCKTSTGVSLNDIQLTGAKLQDNLYDIVLRFRKHRIALSADIVKMYRQILVHPDDQNYQRLLWREEPKAEIQEYCLRTVTYGMAAAPYMAIRALRQLAMSEAANFPVASNAALSDFYVDDLITGCDDINEAIKLQRDLSTMLSSGGFELKKWSSNESAVLKHLPAGFCESQSPLAMSDDDVVGTLGILWYPNNDNFGFTVRRLSAHSNITKRSILSEISRLFDPLGWLSPSIIVGKMLIQELWLIGVNWDELVPDEVAVRWSEYYDGLAALESIRIPRWLKTSPDATIQLHGFSDASEKAMAAVVYLRATSASGCVTSTLVTAKTKVAPVKTISVPRLELCAAQMMAKLLVYVKRTLELAEDTRCIAWTDSTIVLAWLQKHPNTLKTFVANRVSDIQGRTPPSCWRHVRSNDNPADCASRGVAPTILSTHELWWTGPPWLIQSEDEWPKTVIPIIDESVLEVKSSALAIKTVNEEDQSEWDLLSKFSNYNRLIRITALVQRFVTNCRSSQKTRQFGWLTTAELQSATNLWLKTVQRHAFLTEIACCKSSSKLPKTSKLRRLAPFVDEDGFLRVGGRLNAANLPFDHRKPIILPEGSKFTILLISDFHLKFLHAGTQLTLTNLRVKYWVSRRSVSNIIRRCIICCRQRGATQQQLMGDLPHYRIQQCDAFLRSGVDYAGPVKLRMNKGRGSKTLTKAYIALFVCMTTKAIHMELVSDLTTDAFLAAFRRFISRRGPCRELYSDNGTNFVGAKKELIKVLKDEKLDRSLVNDGTSWHMIPAGSPHQGGLWEAGVKAAKHHLRRVLLDINLTYEEFYTVLVQIEACLNSRPLCPVNDCPMDLTALTPAHLAFGRQLTAVPELDLSDLPSSPRNRWHLVQKLQQHFWKRWHNEYLSTLQTRPKWRTAMKNVKVGDLAIIKDENLPPTKWNLARVTECHPGPDGLVRVVTLKTSAGSTKRSIQKICILPVD